MSAEPSPLSRREIDLDDRAGGHHIPSRPVAAENLGSVEDEELDFDLTAILSGETRGRGAIKLDRFEPNPGSATVTIRTVLKTLAITILAVLLFGAEGVIHEAQTAMGSGPVQSATLAVGQVSLDFDEIFHLNGPWNAAVKALGQPPTVACAYCRHRKTASGGKTGKHGTTGKHHHPIKPTGPPPLRTITAAHPLRILVTGDSMVGYIGPWVLTDAYNSGPSTGWSDVHDGTGLTKPLLLDWSLEARQQAQKYHPDALVVMMGGNDFENMTLPNRFFAAGTSSWTREYERRAEIVMRAWIHHGVRRVYWLSMPPAGNKTYSHDYRQIDVALKRAAANVPGVEYIDVNGPITNGGRYSAYVRVNGVETLVRELDGIHINDAGSKVVAGEVIPLIEREWQSSWTDIRSRTRQHRRHTRELLVVRRARKRLLTPLVEQ
jgi:hypothetical protein